MSLSKCSTMVRVSPWSVLNRLICRARHAARSVSTGSLKAKQGRLGAHRADAEPEGSHHVSTATM
eukprot:2740667-Prymnesium_polylepis.1